MDSICRSFDKKGFTFVEAIAPCPIGYGRPNKLGSGLDEMRYYREMSEVRNGADPKDVEITLGGKITVGAFVDTERPDFLQNYYSKVVAKAQQKSGGRPKGRAA